MKIALVVTALLLSFQSTVAFVGPSSQTTSKTALHLGLPPKENDNLGLENVFYQNQAWKASKLVDDPNFFNNLGKTHTPEFMWIGCSDARVPPNVVVGEDAGNLFVHRNVANMVVNTDPNLMSSLQYGVSYLKVKHIIVCGHYECGGVRAAEANNDFIAPLELWLGNIRDVYANHAEELDAIDDPDVRHRRLVDLNVIQQCVNILKTGIVQARRKETYAEGEVYMSPLVHGMVFDPKSGLIKRVEVDFNEFADELTEVYGLYLVKR